MTESERSAMAEGKQGMSGSPAPERTDEGRAVEPTRAYRGFFPIVYGNKVEVKRGGGMFFLAKDEIEIEQGGGQWMIGLRKAELERGGCAVMVTGGRAEVSRGLIGVLLSPRVELKDGSRVLMTFRQALAAGAAAGAVIGLAMWLTGRRPSAGE